MELKRLKPLRGGNPRVDFSNDIIRDVVIVQEGEAKGHGVWLDSNFVKDIALQGNEGERIKSRFGHPNMCGNSLGDYLGVFTNFSTKENGGKLQAVADLALNRAIADKSPKYEKSLTDYILNFTANEPDMLGNSIVFSGKEEKRQVKEKGKTSTKIFMVLNDKGFSASDIVDEPAATSGMFSEYNIANAVTQFISSSEIDFNQFDELFQDKSFRQFAEMLLKNPKISHRILKIITEDKEIYSNFKNNFKESTPINMDKLIQMFNS